MRKLILLAGLAGMIACKKESSPAPPPPPPTPVSDSATVTVINGYGSGRYKTGDTVHIFCQAYADDQLFDTWTSADQSLLDGKNEWHTWFLMPARNVSFTGSIKTTGTVTLNFEQIKGRDRLKPVYYYFPTGHKGFVYLLHGTSGTAQNLANSYEWRQLIKDLVNDQFGIIITESEESTTGIDTNGDGKIRWATTPFDSVTNVDYANIKAITDTFYNRGITNRSKTRYAVGMSNGGNFSAYLSSLFSYKAGVSYCAPAGIISATSITPQQFCMARFDNNENVGPMGNAAALSNSQLYTSRGICSKYFIKEHAPLFPERFARKGDIPLSKSVALFNELKAKGWLTATNYFIGYSDALTAAYQSNPLAYPELNSLTILQKFSYLEQIDLSVSDHQMYSDYNRATLRFLNQQCF